VDRGHDGWKKTRLLAVPFDFCLAWLGKQAYLEGQREQSLRVNEAQARQHGFVSDAVLGISGIPCIFRPYLQNKGIEKIQKFTEKNTRIYKKNTRIREVRKPQELKTKERRTQRCLK
jgi:hypothetical protein